MGDTELTNEKYLMPHKQVCFHSEAREKILRGASALADAVRVTLGPKSKCVLIEKKWGKPLVCNDGVTIAKEFDVEDREENLGAQMIREAAERTGEAVGDGTSTSTILAHAIFAEGVRNVTAGASAVDIKRGLDRAVAYRGRGAQENFAPGREQEGEGGRSPRSPRTTIPRSASWSPMRWRKWGRKVRSPSKKRKEHRDDAGSRRRNAVRSRLSLALLRHQPGEDGSGARRSRSFF